MKIPIVVLSWVIFVGSIFYLPITNSPSKICPNWVNDAGSSHENPLFPVTGSDSCQLNTFNPTSLYHFSETCQRNYPWSNGATNNVIIDTPASYNATSASFSFLVMDPNLNESTIVDAANTANVSNYEQAQGFRTSNDTFFAGFSFYALGNGTNQIIMELRNESYAGLTLATFNVNLPAGPAWVNVTLSPPIFLRTGHYYLFMAWSGSNGSSGATCWAHVTSNMLAISLGDAWTYSQGAWSQQVWNLTLKVRTYVSINPSTVGMNVSTQPVVDLGNGQGLVDVTQDIMGLFQEFIIQNDSPILFYYAVNVTYYGTLSISNANFLPEQGQLNWNISIPFTDPIYVNYQAKITDMQSDYNNLQICSGKNTIGFTWVNTTTIQFASPANYITFDSPNYITDIECPTLVYPGSNANINVSVRGMGFVSVFIFQNAILLYQNCSTANMQASFAWPVQMSQTTGQVIVQVYFSGTNEVGINSSLITIITHPPSLGLVPVTIGVFVIIVSGIAASFTINKYVIHRKKMLGRSLDQMIIDVEAAPQAFPNPTRNNAFTNVIFYKFGLHGPEIIYSEHPLTEGMALASGAYYYTALGQGRQYSRGLFGPLPFGEQTTPAVAIIYAAQVSDTSRADPRLSNQTYFMIALIYSPEDASIVDRTHLEQELGRITGEIRDLATMTAENFSEMVIQIRAV